MFPSDLCSYVPQLHHPRDKTGFRHLFAHFPVAAATSYLHNCRITSKPIEWNKNLERQYILTGKESYYSHLSDSLKPWSAVEKRPSNDANGYRQNTDVRTYFVIDRHTFLVKPMFTFGLTFLRPGTVHVYTLTTMPLALYVANIPHHRTNVERVFSAGDQFIYKVHVLQPHRSYYLPELLRYVIVSQYRTLFSVHVTERPPIGSVRFDEVVEEPPIKSEWELAAPALEPQLAAPALEPQPFYCVLQTFSSTPDYARWGRSLLTSRYDSPPIPPDFVPASLKEEKPMDLSTRDVFAQLLIDLCDAC